MGNEKTSGTQNKKAASFLLPVNHAAHHRTAGDGAPPSIYRAPLKLSIGFICHEPAGWGTQSLWRSDFVTSGEVGKVL